MTEKDILKRIYGDLFDAWCDAVREKKHKEYSIYDSFTGEQLRRAIRSAVEEGRKIDNAWRDKVLKWLNSQE